MSAVSAETANLIIALVGLLVVIGGAFLTWAFRNEREKATMKAQISALQTCAKEKDDKIHALEKSLNYLRGQHDPIRDSRRSPF